MICDNLTFWQFFKLGFGLSTGMTLATTIWSIIGGGLKAYFTLKEMKGTK
jgi:hypothetical protein